MEIQRADIEQMRHDACDFINCEGLLSFPGDETPNNGVKQ